MCSLYVGICYHETAGQNVVLYMYYYFRQSCYMVLPFRPYLFNHNGSWTLQNVPCHVTFSFALMPHLSYTPTAVRCCSLYEI